MSKEGGIKITEKYLMVRKWNELSELFRGR